MGARVLGILMGPWSLIRVIEVSRGILGSVSPTSRMIAGDDMLTEWNIAICDESIIERWEETE
jgi:hypothetical protein